MRVEGSRPLSQYAFTGRPLNRFEAVMNSLQRHGKVLLNNTEMDAQIIDKLKEIYGDQIQVQHSDSIMVTVG